MLVTAQQDAQAEIVAGQCARLVWNTIAMEGADPGPGATWPECAAPTTSICAQRELQEYRRRPPGGKLGNVYSPVNINNKVNSSTNPSALNKPLNVYAPANVTNNVDESTNITATNNINNRQIHRPQIRPMWTVNNSVKISTTNIFNGSGGSHSGGGGMMGGGLRQRRRFVNQRQS